MLAFWFLLSGVPLARCQEPPGVNLQEEYDVKAVFLYGFGRYVQWPEKAFRATPDAFIIGIVGENPFGGTLKEIANKKTIHGRKIVLRQFPSAEQYQGVCHLVFVTHSLAPEQQRAAIQKIRGVGVMLVGESPGFAEQGGMANFYLNEDRVRFEINRQATKAAQLQMDAKLLNLGKPVNEGSPPPQAQILNARTGS